MRNGARMEGILGRMRAIISSRTSLCHVYQASLDELRVRISLVFFYIGVAIGLYKNRRGLG